MRPATVTSSILKKSSTDPDLLPHSGIPIPDSIGHLQNFISKPSAPTIKHKSHRHASVTSSTKINSTISVKNNHKSDQKKETNDTFVISGCKVTHQQYIKLKYSCTQLLSQHNPTNNWDFIIDLFLRESIDYSATITSPSLRIISQKAPTAFVDFFNIVRNHASRKQLSYYLIMLCEMSLFDEFLVEYKSQNHLQLNDYVYFRLGMAFIQLNNDKHIAELIQHTHDPFKLFFPSDKVGTDYIRQYIYMNEAYHVTQPVFMTYAFMVPYIRFLTDTEKKMLVIRADRLNLHSIALSVLITMKDSQQVHNAILRNLEFTLKKKIADSSPRGLLSWLEFASQHLSSYEMSTIIIPMIPSLIFNTHGRVYNWLANSRDNMIDSSDEIMHNVIRSDYDDIDLAFKQFYQTIVKSINKKTIDGLIQKVESGDMNEIKKLREEKTNEITSVDENNQISVDIESLLTPKFESVNSLSIKSSPDLSHDCFSWLPLMKDSLSIDIDSYASLDIDVIQNLSENVSTKLISFLKLSNEILSLNHPSRRLSIATLQLTSSVTEDQIDALSASLQTPTNTTPISSYSSLSNDEAPENDHNKVTRRLALIFGQYYDSLYNIQGDDVCPRTMYQKRLQFSSKEQERQFRIINALSTKPLDMTPMLSIHAEAGINFDSGALYTYTPSMTVITSSTVSETRKNTSLGILREKDEIELSKLNIRFALLSAFENNLYIDPSIRYLRDFFVCTFDKLFILYDKLGFEKEREWLTAYVQLSLDHWCHNKNPEIVNFARQYGTKNNYIIDDVNLEQFLSEKDKKALQQHLLKSKKTKPTI